MKLCLSNQPEPEMLSSPKTTFSITFAASALTDCPMLPIRTSIQFLQLTKLWSVSYHLFVISTPRLLIPIIIGSSKSRFQPDPRLVSALAYRQPLSAFHCLLLWLKRFRFLMLLFDLAGSPLQLIGHRFLTTLWSFCFFQPRLVYIPVAVLRVGNGVNSYSLELVSV